MATQPACTSQDRRPGSIGFVIGFTLLPAQSRVEKNDAQRPRLHRYMLRRRSPSVLVFLHRNTLRGATWKHPPSQARARSRSRRKCGAPWASARAAGASRVRAINAQVCANLRGITVAGQPHAGNGIRSPWLAGYTVIHAMRRQSAHRIARAWFRPACPSGAKLSGTRFLTSRGDGPEGCRHGWRQQNFPAEIPYLT